MRFRKIDVDGDPNIGLRGFATDEYAIFGREIPEAEILEAEIHLIKIAQTELAGIFAAGNSNGIILPYLIEREELEEIKKLGLNFAVLKTKETLMGNLVLCNDKGAVISPLLKRWKREIESTLNCEVEVGKIANLSIPGACGIATNKGCLLHREAREEEINLVKEVLKVKVSIGSVGGSPFVKSGIIANSNAVLVGENATGPELERIMEVLG